MRELIISVSGLRGVVGDSLTPPVAAAYVGSFIAELGPGPILLSRDGRDSGPMLRDVIQGAIIACGRLCIDADVAATPTTGVLVRSHKMAGGVQISASHNPAEYNGIKLFGPDGRVVPADIGQRVKQRYESGDIRWVMHDQLRLAVRCDDATSHHLQLVLAVIDVERIRRRKFRVLLDANHGAGSVLGKRLLAELGCQMTILGETPDGRYEHPPEPTADNLASVLAQVKQHRADVGFCQDPDADRLAVIDEQGRYIGEEYTPAMCVAHLLQSRPGAVVSNCSSSRMSQDVAEKFGVPFYHAAVGEANVCDVMLQHDAVFGAEGNGGVIDPRVGLVRDSFVGMALLLDAMAGRELPISELAAELPRYEIVKTKIALPKEKLCSGLTALREHFAVAKASDLDGLRLDWPDKWMLIRASNTEPIVRVIAEAKCQQEAARLCAEAARILAAA
ncbi:MAG: phosphoglucosamine mutase [Pirellulales bacterium]